MHASQEAEFPRRISKTACRHARGTCEHVSSRQSAGRARKERSEREERAGKVERSAELVVVVVSPEHIVRCRIHAYHSTYRLWHEHRSLSVQHISSGSCLNEESAADRYLQTRPTRGSFGSTQAFSPGPGTAHPSCAVSKESDCCITSFYHNVPEDQAPRRPDGSCQKALRAAAFTTYS